LSTQVMIVNAKFVTRCTAT